MNPTYTSPRRRAEQSDVISGVGKAGDALRRLRAMDITMPEGAHRDSVVRELERIGDLCDLLIEQVCAPEDIS